MKQQDWQDTGERAGDRLADSGGHGSVVRVQADSIGLAFHGQRPVLDDVEFTINSGEFVSIVGPSGCGKTSLLRLVAGLLTPTAGRLTVSGTARRAFVFQEPNLLPWRNVVDNIRLPLELLRELDDPQLTAIHDSLRMIGLAEADHGKYPRMLSGGMKMRVALARAMITRPRILLLDEPFAALDDMLRQQLNEDLLRIWGQQHWTALFVTHNVMEAVFLSQRIFIMRSDPGTITASVDVPFPYPRDASLRGNAEFTRLAFEVGERLRSGVR